MIEQLTVFLENSEGHLLSLCHALADAGVDMSALTIAETSEYGLVRIICDDPAAGKAALDKAGLRSTITKVAAIEVPNRPGGLVELLEMLKRLNLNIEYGYCFSTSGGRVIDVFRIKGIEEAAPQIEAAGFRLLDAADLRA